MYLILNSEGNFIITSLKSWKGFKKALSQYPYLTKLKEHLENQTNKSRNLVLLNDIF